LGNVDLRQIARTAVVVTVVSAVVGIVPTVAVFVAVVFAVAADIVGIVPTVAVFVASLLSSTLEVVAPAAV
jgi:hypothetical protein